MHFLVLHIGEACCRENWNYKNICSPFTRIYYVTKGYAQIELPDKKQDLHPGLMYIIPAFTTHSYICHGEFCHYYIHIYNESDHDILEDWELPTEIRTENETLSYIRKLYKLCPGLELTQTDPQYYDNSPALTRNILKNKQRELYTARHKRVNPKNKALKYPHDNKAADMASPPVKVPGAQSVCWLWMRAAARRHQ